SPAVSGAVALAMAAQVRSLISLAILLAAYSFSAAADDRGIRLGAESTSQWRFGVVVTAVGSPVSGIRATLPVPMDWPEQTVKKIAEDKSPGADVSFRTLEAAPGHPGVRQMGVWIPRLAAGEQASAVVTLEI